MPAKGSAYEKYGEMDDDQEHNKRDHSPNAHDDEFEQFMLDMENLIQDVTSDTYSMQDLIKLSKKCVDYHKRRIGNIDGAPGEGWYEEWARLAPELSCLNVLKCAKLAKANEMLWNFWEQDLDGRHARHLNACLGQEIDRLFDLQHYYNVDRNEMYRHGHLKTKYWKLCPYNDEHGECQGNRRGECRYLHAVKR
jgi:hypothetical protein